MEAYKREFIEFLQDAGVLKFGDFTAIAGIAYWVNQHFRLNETEQVSKQDSLIIAMKDWIDQEYEDGRQTVMTDHELEEMIERLAPGRFRRR